MQNDSSLMLAPFVTGKPLFFSLLLIIFESKLFSMGEAQERHLHIMAVEENNEAESSGTSANITTRSNMLCFKEYKWWIRMAIYSLFLLAGQSAGTLLGRLYYDKGGESKWLATLAQLAGFPILVPFLFMSLPKNFRTNRTQLQTWEKTSFLMLASVYVVLGLLLAAVCMLYSIGLLYIPVSTYSLICASQLGFNAFFSFFLNSQRFTAPIINSLVLLTISSVLLVFQPDSENTTGVSKGKYVIGFLSTVGASAGYALLLSLTQLAYKKVLKKQTFPTVINLIIYQSLVATCAAVVGLFASGEWNDLSSEMVNFELGKVSYLMTLIWIAISWQVFSIGATGLIFEVSALFSNVISTLGLPIVPVFAVFLFHDKMNGIKVISMVLALWGFVSYIYHQYLDDRKSKEKETNHVSNASHSAGG